MSKSNKDSLGDRMKRYESCYSQSTIDNLPIICRLDGKAFHTFTKGLKRPYDTRLSKLMVDTTRFLIKTGQAHFGYTQSDEISLLFFKKIETSELPFRGNVNKLNSILASIATFYFNEHKRGMIPEKADKPAYFDCRTFSLPSQTEVYNYFLWRERDAVRNSLQMLAQSMFSHKELQNKNSSELHELLHKNGVNWAEESPHFKSGSYLKREKVTASMSPEKILKQTNGRMDIDKPVDYERSVINVSKHYLSYNKPQEVNTFIFGD